MSHKANLLMIAAPARMHKFMVAADLFEEGKVLGSIEWLTVTYEEGVELTLERAYKVIECWSQAKHEGYIVSLVHLVSVDVGKEIIFNKGKLKPYWKKDARIISTGHKWFMLDDYVRHLGFTVKTDEHRYITDIE